MGGCEHGSYLHFREDEEGAHPVCLGSARSLPTEDTSGCNKEPLASQSQKIIRILGNGALHSAPGGPR